MDVCAVEGEIYNHFPEFPSARIRVATAKQMLNLANIREPSKKMQTSSHLQTSPTFFFLLIAYQTLMSSRLKLVPW
jgi:hypothetical protein